MTRYAIEYLDRDSFVVLVERCETDYALDAASLGHEGLKDARKEFGAVDFRIHNPETGDYYKSNLQGFNGSGDDEEEINSA